MNEKKKEIAQKFAPVLCHELSRNKKKRIFDCFSSIKFTEDDPWEMEDRIAEFRKMFSFKEENIIESSLIPSVYYSLVETHSHYFLLYSIYHALDQKSPFGHEHDMENVQVVVRKSGEVVEYVTTNAHHAYFYYVNDDNPVRPHPPYLDTSENGKIVLYQDTHPVVYIQPGDGSIFSVFTEQIGHGILGIGGVYKGLIKYDWSHKWHEDSKTFDFENKDEGETIGIVAMVADDDNPARPYLLENKVIQIHYELESVEQSIWEWFKHRASNKSIGKLFKEEESWKPSSLKIRGESRSRRKYFEETFSIDKIAYPAGFVGTKDISTGKVRAAAGSWPFQYKNRVTGKRFSYITRRSAWKDVPAINLDVFFDPASAYKIMVTSQDRISTKYTYHPFV